MFQNSRWKSGCETIPSTERRPKNIHVYRICSLVNLATSSETERKHEWISACPVWQFIRPPNISELEQVFFPQAWTLFAGSLLSQILKKHVWPVTCLIEVVFILTGDSCLNVWVQVSHSHSEMIEWVWEVCETVQTYSSTWMCVGRQPLQKTPQTLFWKSIREQNVFYQHWLIW